MTKTHAIGIPTLTDLRMPLACSGSQFAKLIILMVLLTTTLLHGKDAVNRTVPVVDPQAAKNEAKDPSTIMQGSQADVTWAELNTQMDSQFSGAEYEAARSAGPESFYRWHLKRMRDYRVLGLEFFERFPDDERRWLWFERTMSLPQAVSLYFSDIGQAAAVAAAGAPELAQIDLPAKTDWERRYQKMRAEFLSHPSVSEKRRWLFKFTELRWWSLEQGYAVKRGETVDYEKVRQALMELAADPEASSQSLSVPRIAAEVLHHVPMNTDQEALFIAAMASSRNTYLREFAAAKERAFRLRAQPLEEQFVDLSGKTVSASDWRGKVVILDCWASWCSNCPEAARDLKPLFERYRSCGLSVFGVSADTERTRKDAARIIEREGLAWPQLFAPEFMRKYEVRLIPTFILFDQKGLLIACVTTATPTKDLEPMVRKALGLAPAEGDTKSM